MANIVEYIHSTCTDPSLDPSGFIRVEVEYDKGGNNRISCFLNIDSGCGHDGMLYDYYLYVGAQGKYGPGGEEWEDSEQISQPMVYSIDYGVSRTDNFGATSYPWVGWLAFKDTVIIYGTFSSHTVPSISCTFPRTEIALE
ncbi:MAG: hypothetical protein ACOYEQ_02640 [Bacillota bacterium]|jgi:hypothetical protein